MNFMNFKRVSKVQIKKAELKALTALLTLTDEDPGPGDIPYFSSSYLFTKIPNRSTKYWISENDIRTFLEAYIENNAGMVLGHVSKQNKKRKTRSYAVNPSRRKELEKIVKLS